LKEDSIAKSLLISDVTSDLKGRAMNKLQKLTLELYNTLEEIGEEHEELFDTDVREAMHASLDYYFVWDSFEENMPITYSMFSKEGDAKVAEAIQNYCRKATETAQKMGIKPGQDREDVLQDGSLETNQGQYYDDFIGFAEEVLPPKKPHQLYFEELEYDFDE
jgi:hypothetical protein